MKRLVVLFLVLAVAGAACSAVTIDSVLEKVKANFVAVDDYSARAVMSLDSPTVHVSGSKFKTYYKKPDKVRIEPESGFTIVPQGTYLGNPFEEITRDNDLKLLGEGKLNGRACWKVGVTPSVKRPGGMEAVLWIDKARGLILASRAEPAPDAKINVDWEYIRVDGKYWLPSVITVTMDGLPSSIARQRGESVNSSGKSNGKAVIKFSDYRVNKGISDSVFGRKNKK